MRHSSYNLIQMLPKAVEIVATSRLKDTGEVCFRMASLVRAFDVLEMPGISPTTLGRALSAVGIYTYAKSCTADGRLYLISDARNRFEAVRKVAAAAARIALADESDFIEDKEATHICCRRTPTPQGYRVTFA